MADKRRALGRGLGALFPEEQKETRSRATDVFFSSPIAKETTSADTSDKSDTVVSEADTVKESGETKPATARKTTAKKTTAKKAASEASSSEDSMLSENAAKEGAGLEISLDLAAGSGTETASEPGVPAKGKGRAGGTPTGMGMPDLATAATADTADPNGLLPVPGATFGDIPVDAIIPNTRQPREVFDEDDLQELADSIAEVGVLQPIVVRGLAEHHPDNPDAQYELIMGERRWRASQRAGKDTVPAIVRHTDDADLLRDALLENLHRANLNALEEAAAYQQLLEDFRCTQEELSRRIARSRPQISNTLRLLKLPPLVQRRVAAGVLSAGHARALLGLTDPAAMERLAQRIVAEGLSVRQVEETVAIGEDYAPARARGPRRGRYAEELNELAGRLSDRFNTRVKVNMGLTKGRIAIEFATIEDLNRILDNLSEGAVAVEAESGAAQQA